MSAGHKQYWPIIEKFGGSRPGQSFELRSAMAWELLRTPGALTIGISDGEDSAGRQKLRPRTSYELVQEAYEIVDQMLAVAESRGEVRLVESDGGGA